MENARTVPTADGEGRRSQPSSSSDLHQLVRTWLSRRIDTLQKEQNQQGQDSPNTAFDAVSDVYDDNSCRPGAFRIGRDGNPIPTNDRESHLLSILGSLSSTATPHARPVYSTSSLNATNTSVSEEVISGALMDQTRDISRPSTVSTNQHHAQHLHAAGAAINSTPLAPNGAITAAATEATATNRATSRENDTAMRITTEADVIRVLEEQMLVLLASRRDLLQSTNE